MALSGAQRARPETHPCHSSCRQSHQQLTIRTRLFRGKANCNSCHLDGRSTAPSPTAPNAVDTGTAADTAPVFTCFGYANLGLPKNPRDAFYFQTKPDFFGFTPNPGGFTYTDFGLGTFLRSGFGAAPNPNSDWVKFAPTSDGQMQTSTARDVGLAPPNARPLKPQDLTSKRSSSTTATSRA